MFLISLLLKIIALNAFVLLYAAGGQGHKWTKKWVGPSVFAALVILIAFLDKKLSIFTVIGSLSYLAAANGFAYGEKFTHNKTGLKILFRGLCGASYGLCGLIISINTGHFIVGLAQLFLATAGSIIFGVLNPFSNLGDKGVVLEDLCIALFAVGLVLFLI